jgi:hypothetical protein
LHGAFDRSTARTQICRDHNTVDVTPIGDQLARGRRARILNIIDDVTKECRAAVADTSMSGKRVARVTSNYTDDTPMS